MRTLLLASAVAATLLSLFSTAATAECDTPNLDFPLQVLSGTDFIDVTSDQIQCDQKPGHYSIDLGGAEMSAEVTATQVTLTYSEPGLEQTPNVIPLATTASGLSTGKNVLLLPVAEELLLKVAADSSAEYAIDEWMLLIPR
jgi:hypothetical protein